MCRPGTGAPIFSEARKNIFKVRRCLSVFPVDSDSLDLLLEVKVALIATGILSVCFPTKIEGRNSLARRWKRFGAAPRLSTNRKVQHETIFRPQKNFGRVKMFFRTSSGHIFSAFGNLLGSVLAGSVRHILQGALALESCHTQAQTRVEIFPNSLEHSRQNCFLNELYPCKWYCKHYVRCS